MTKIRDKEQSGSCQGLGVVPSKEWMWQGLERGTLRGDEIALYLIRLGGGYLNLHM